MQAKQEITENTSPAQNGLKLEGDCLDNFENSREKALWTVANFASRNLFVYRIARILRSIKKNGIKEISEILMANGNGYRSSLKKETKLTKSEKSTQTSAKFQRDITITIITPLFNPPEQHLKEMIASVLSQTYGKWELFLIDLSDNEQENMEKTCKCYAQNDRRIKYVKGENQSISVNLNKAIEASSGEYFGIVEAIDLLHPCALYEVIKVICIENADFIYSDEAAFSNKYVTLKHHKPDFAVDTLCSFNYINRFTVFSKKLAEKAGTFNSEYDGNHEYDLIFRYSDAAVKICHISKLLYFKRDHKKYFFSTNGKKPAVSAEIDVIKNNLKSRGITAQVEKKFGLYGFYKVNYELTEKPLVSIIIPNKDNVSMLQMCLSFIVEKTTYDNYEIIIVENNSVNDSTFAYYKELSKYKNINVVHWKGRGFNFSELCNFGAKHSRGEHLLFLNNDVFIITTKWLEEMLMYSQRSDVGVVGAKLYFLNGTVQHAGMVLGLGGTAGHIYHSAPYEKVGYMARLRIAQNMSAVTGACMMIKRSVFDEVGCFNPEFSSSHNDVDLCLRIRKAGYLIVWTPYAEAYHLESKSRGYFSTAVARETLHFKEKWGKIIAEGDPYYNCNFSLKREDYSLKKHKTL